MHRSPSHRRNIVHSPCEPYVRLSFGPPLDELDRGLDGIQRVLEKAKAGHEMGKGYKQHATTPQPNPQATGA
jgi:hypothetical protein